jgi:polyhydroxyalkanoate synthesis regulator phasin
MTLDPDFLRRLRTRGEEVLTQVSAELSSNPRFMQAMAGAMRGKEKLEAAASRALRQMNVPSRSELKRAVARIDALERELAAFKARARTQAKARGAARRRGAGRRRAGSRAAG